MKKLKYMIFLICCLFCLASCERIVRNKIDIGYLTVSDQFTKEDSAAFNWLVENRYFEPHLVNIDEGVAELKKHDVIWIHIHDSIDYLNWEPYLSDLKPLKNIYQNGGKLFLTNFAALLPYKLCIESNKPGKIEEKIKNYWTFDKRGLQSFRGHPIFSGLFGGSFIWDALEDYKLTEIGYFDDNFPKEGKVVATEKSYIFVKEKKRLAIEYNSERGKILSIGSLIFLGKKNNLRVKMEKFLENSLLYLAGELTEGEKTYWEKFENIPKSFIVETEPIEKAEKRDLKGVQNTRLLFEKDNPKNNFYDISGRRALVMGYQNGGIDEIWVHPFRVIRDFQTGIVMKNSVVWLKDIQLKIEIRPESFTRIYQTKYGQLKEIIYTSLKKPGAIIHYEADVSEPIKLIVKMRSDLRWMWPYAENALGDIYYGYDDRLKAIHIKDLSGDFYCVIGSDIAPSDIVSGQYEDLEWKSGKFKGVSTDLNQVYVAVLYELNSENNYILNCAIVGTNEGQEKAIKDYRYLLKNPEKVYMENVNHYQDLLSTKLTIESPDEEFNNLWKWGLVGTDRFFVETPSLGAALLAGYSTTDRGWDGNHKINGRPGYGWYFGR
ncbi:MAG: DUF4960 domain-containing protein, partial [Candidatus Marinimicrobia bacterium]|nr:DUF4960 domain-containing protein [Candidatus Neomarinimicrobiota bacterium]